MNNIKKEIKSFIISKSDIEAKKYLIKLSDGYNIESVILNHDDMLCACVSCQVGCSLDCKFCATAQMGLKRNLTVKEISSQVKLLDKEVKRVGNSISSFKRILFMGMGEPLLNYKQVVKSAISIHKGLLSYTPEIHLATSGIEPKKIKELITDAPFLKLWISLVVADDNLRKKLMPSNSTISIDVLLNSGEKYAEKTNNLVRVNYIMINGLTDSIYLAKRLVKLLKGRPFKLQLSNYNEIQGNSFKASNIKKIQEFKNITKNAGISTSIFKSKGINVQAACGQLSSTFEDNESDKI